MQDAPSRRKGAFGKWRRAPDGGRIEKKNTEKDRANETGFPLKGMGKYFLFFSRERNGCWGANQKAPTQLRHPTRSEWPISIRSLRLAQKYSLAANIIDT